MLGLGEDRSEVIELMKDLREVRCDLLTMGQYLQPRSDRLPVVRYVTPEEFEELKRIGEEMGFQSVASGPLSGVHSTPLICLKGYEIQAGGYESPSVGMIPVFTGMNLMTLCAMPFALCDFPTQERSRKMSFTFGPRRGIYIDIQDEMRGGNPPLSLEETQYFEAVRSHLPLPVRHAVQLCSHLRPSGRIGLLRPNCHGDPI